MRNKEHAPAEGKKNESRRRKEEEERISCDLTGVYSNTLHTLQLQRFALFLFDKCTVNKEILHPNDDNLCIFMKLYVFLI